jgi:crotonobetaine/carnitine-CoA ligase
MLAAADLGATIVAINPEFRGKLLEGALETGQCKVLVADDSSVPGLRDLSQEALSGIEAVVHVDGVLGRISGAIEQVAWSDLEKSVSQPPAAAPAQPGSIQAVSFTSGSTGPAKGVQITMTQAVDVACTYIHATNLAQEDVLYTPFAFFHGMSTRLGLLPALIVGAHVVIGRRFSASRYWQEAAECGATVGQTLPTMTALLKARPATEHDRKHKITRMYNSRADEEFEKRFGVRLIEAYGMTEIGLVIYSGYPDRRAGAAGKVHADWEMQIVDEEDNPVPMGSSGELVFRPRVPWLVSPGYIGKPQATVESWRNLWFHSGDIGRQDQDGYVYFIDRRKERIRRLGENISSFDVESIVCGHPAVRECAALAYPASIGEDDVRIVVVKAENAELTAGDLYDWLVTAMPKYMLPRYIEFAESLPRTPTNKIEKYQLKQRGLLGGAWDRDVHRPSRHQVVTERAEVNT